MFFVALMLLRLLEMRGKAFSDSMLSGQQGSIPGTYDAANDESRLTSELIILI